MFDLNCLPSVGTLRDLDDAGLVDVMRAAVRLESAVTARRLAAVAELYRRRLHEQDAGDRELWCIDGWEPLRWLSVEVNHDERSDVAVLFKFRSSFVSDDAADEFTGVGVASRTVLAIDAYPLTQCVAQGSDGDVQSKIFGA
jgi:hypothetical protein